MDTYIKIAGKFERLHRCFLDVISKDLETLGYEDISAVQALLVYHIATKKISISDISRSGYYLGSNVSYNLKKLVENDYVEQERSCYDGRTRYISLSKKKGLIFYESLRKRLKKQVESYNLKHPNDHLNIISEQLDKLEDFWRKI